MDDISIEDQTVFSKYLKTIEVTHQKLLDRITPYVSYRWIGTCMLIVLFLCRILFSQGWYIICYGFGIFLLNLFLAFLQPKFDPSAEKESEAEAVEAGDMTNEFRPFIRRLSEFKFWYRSTVAVIVSLILTLTSYTDLPVFWPILLIYFCILFTLTMRKQIQHMIKYHYIPLDIGKKRYSSK